LTLLVVFSQGLPPLAWTRPRSSTTAPSRPVTVASQSLLAVQLRMTRHGSVPLTCFGHPGRDSKTRIRTLESPDQDPVGTALRWPPGAQQEHGAEGCVPGLDVVGGHAPADELAAPLGDQLVQARANVEIATVAAREVTPRLPGGAVVGILPQALLSGGRRIRGEIKIPRHSGLSTAGCRMGSNHFWQGQSFNWDVCAQKLPMSHPSAQSIVARRKSQGKR